MGLDPAYTSAPWSERPTTSKCPLPSHRQPASPTSLRDVGEDPQPRSVFNLPPGGSGPIQLFKADLMAGTINDNWRALNGLSGCCVPVSEFSRSEQGAWLAADTPAGWSGPRLRTVSGHPSAVIEAA